MTGEEWAPAVTVFFSGLAAGLLGMLCTIMRPMLQAMDGRDFRNFMGAFLQFVGNSWGKVYNLAWSLVMGIGPIVARASLGRSRLHLVHPHRDRRGDRAHRCLARLQRVEDPDLQRDLVLGPRRDAAGLGGGATQDFTINWIQLATTGGRSGLFLVALISL